MTIDHAAAGTILTTGSGSAVTVANGIADFESINALNDNPYSEGGMLFSRTGLSFNNNGCGYASTGCTGWPSGFVGNYMYGAGGGYFEMTAAAGTMFQGLEFVFSGGSQIGLMPMLWETYDSSNTLVGSGSGAFVSGTILGFSNATGFTTLRYTSGFAGVTLPYITIPGTHPAFDSVRAQLVAASSAAIPEPASGLMILLGSVMLGAALRRRR